MVSVCGTISYPNPTPLNNFLVAEGNLCGEEGRLQKATARNGSDHVTIPAEWIFLAMVELGNGSIGIRLT